MVNARSAVRISIVFGLVMTALVLALLSPSLRAQINDSGAISIPAMVIRDSTDGVVGGVVGVDNNKPYVVLTEGSNKVLLRVGKTEFASQARVFFTNTTCDSAQIYLDLPVTVGGLDEMQDVMYGIGPGNVLYRSDVLMNSVMTMSEWISVNPVGPTQCFVSTKMGDRMSTVMVQDLDTIFPPPYTVE